MTITKNEKGPFFEGKKQKNYGDGLDEHVQNFLQCIREGGKVNTPVEVGAKVAIVSEMGNIAYRTGKRIHWDDSANKFLEDDASKLMNLEYRNPWKLPKV